MWKCLKTNKQTNKQTKQQQQQPQQWQREESLTQSKHHTLSFYLELLRITLNFFVDKTSKSKKILFPMRYVPPWSGEKT